MLGNRSDRPTARSRSHSPSLAVGSPMDCHSWRSTEPTPRSTSWPTDCRTTNDSTCSTSVPPWGSSGCSDAVSRWRQWSRICLTARSSRARISRPAAPTWPATIPASASRCRSSGDGAPAGHVARRPRGKWEPRWLGPHRRSGSRCLHPTLCQQYSQKTV